MANPPIKFIVGDTDKGADFSKEYVEALIYKIAMWFSSPDCATNHEDPVAESRKKVQECLLGLNGKGEPWNGAPKEFAKRIKAKCNFDMDTETGIPNKKNSTRSGQKAHDVAATEAADELEDTLVEVADFNQQEYRQQLEEDTYKAFPELDNPATRPHVQSYTLLMAQRVVTDRQLALVNKGGRQRDNLLKTLKTISEMADAQMKMLGIHPDQIRRSISNRASGTISEYAAIAEGDDNYRRREKIWARQLALQLWWMSQHLDGRKAGPQLHDFEIFHMTRSRPKKFTCRCGHTSMVLDGFTPQEIFDFLLAEGVLVEEPVVPGLITKKDTAGLQAHMTALKESADAE